MKFLFIILTLLTYDRTTQYFVIEPNISRYTPKFPVNSMSYGSGYVFNVGKKLAPNSNNEQNIYKNHSAFNKFANLEIVNSDKNIDNGDKKTHASCKSADEDKVIERATQIVMYVPKNLKHFKTGVWMVSEFLKIGKIILTIIFTIQLLKNSNLFYILSLNEK